MNAFLRQGFCFTGKAKLKGVDVTRGELERFITDNGGNVYPKVNAMVDILVASRSDTTKARDALNMGKRVITYDEFFTMAGILHPADLGRPAQPVSPTATQQRQQMEAKERVKAKREALKREALAFEEAEQQIEGWGMF